MVQTHYFTDNRELSSNRKEHPFSFQGHAFTFVTDDGVFSKDGVDMGTQVLLKAIYEDSVQGSVLDMGCGYGVLGIVTKTLFPDVTVDCVDVNPRALELASINSDKNKAKVNTILSNVYENVSSIYDTILTNPPIRAGKSVVFEIYEGAYEHLRASGKLLVVIRKQQGAESSKKKLIELFGNCEVIMRSKGYWILKCTKQ